MISFSIVLIVISGSCKKEEHGRTEISPVEGKWELRMHDEPGQALVNYDEGNGNLLVFTNDKFEIWKNGTLSKNGQFYILTVYPPQTLVISQRIILQTNPLTVYYMDREGDWLWLYEPTSTGSSIHERYKLVKQ